MVPLSISDLHQACHASIAFPRGALALARAVVFTLQTPGQPREPSMNPANLPFDSEAMLQGLKTWVECESPTWDAGAVERMLDIAARDMAIMGASIERIAGRQGFAGCV